MADPGRKAGDGPVEMVACGAVGDRIDGGQSPLGLLATATPEAGPLSATGWGRIAARQRWPLRFT